MGRNVGWDLSCLRDIPQGIKSSSRDYMTAGNKPYYNRKQCLPYSISVFEIKVLFCAPSGRTGS